MATGLIFQNWRNFYIVVGNEAGKAVLSWKIFILLMGKTKHLKSGTFSGLSSGRQPKPRSYSCQYYYLRCLSYHWHLTLSAERWHWSVSSRCYMARDVTQKQQISHLCKQQLWETLPHAVKYHLPCWGNPGANAISVVLPAKTCKVQRHSFNCWLHTQYRRYAYLKLSWLSVLGM